MLRYSLCLIIAISFFALAQPQGTLDTVRTRGELSCGVSDLMTGTLIKIEDGGLEGFYTEFCRALAAAILGDKEAVVYIPLSPVERFRALQAGEVDIVVGSVTMTSSADASFNFGPIVFHEGKQPHAPAIRAGDDTWQDVVNWVIHALIQAEEWGLTSVNIEAVAGAVDAPALKRFLGLEHEAPSIYSLDTDALYRTILQVGNYGEIYNRHLGPNATLSLPRGANQLWSEGGRLFAPPFSAR